MNKNINKQEIEENPELLLSYYKKFMAEMLFNTERIQYIENLMNRKSAKNWSVKKKQKMVRRLTQARQTIKQLEPMLDQVNVRLKQTSMI